MKRRNEFLTNPCLLMQTIFAQKFIIPNLLKLCKKESSSDWLQILYVPRKFYFTEQSASSYLQFYYPQLTQIAQIRMKLWLTTVPRDRCTAFIRYMSERRVWPWTYIGQGILFLDPTHPTRYTLGPLSAKHLGHIRSKHCIQKNWFCTRICNRVPLQLYYLQLTEIV